MPEAWLWCSLGCCYHSAHPLLPAPLDPCLCYGSLDFPKLRAKLISVSGLLNWDFTVNGSPSRNLANPTFHLIWDGNRQKCFSFAMQLEPVKKKFRFHASHPQITSAASADTAVTGTMQKTHLLLDFLINTCKGSRLVLEEIALWYGPAPAQDICWHNQQAASPSAFKEVERIWRQHILSFQSKQFTEEPRKGSHRGMTHSQYKNQTKYSITPCCQKGQLDALPSCSPQLTPCYQRWHLPPSSILVGSLVIVFPALGHSFYTCFHSIWGLYKILLVSVISNQRRLSTPSKNTSNIN